jgi:hypothetical protein
MYVFATTTASLREPGTNQRVSIHRGSAWHADCPLVRAHRSMFSDTPPDVFPRDWEPVEQATAAPGEKRNTRRG